MIDLASAVSRAADLADPALASHHRDVAFLAARIAAEMGLDAETSDRVVSAAIVHDIGALSLAERMATLRFDFRDGYAHCEPGYLLLRRFPAFDRVAAVVRTHHVDWADGAGMTYLGEPVPFESHVIHVADRAAVLLDRGSPVLDQREAIVRTLRDNTGGMFMPDAVAAFERLAVRESFWLDLAARPDPPAGTPAADVRVSSLDGAELDAFAGVLSRVVDFRSRFTATHTAGVAAVASALARVCGMTAADVARIGLAGDLHDVGKLAVPSEILEKAGPLDGREWARMKTHTYHTYRVLDSTGALKSIAPWAAFHHEHLDGGGYPFHVGAADLDRASRAMTVADIFTAVREDRPYRPGMTREQAVEVLRDGAASGATDGTLVGALLDAFDDVDAARVDAQGARRAEFDAFETALESRARRIARAKHG